VIRIPLAACPGCARHIRINEPECPFCRAELPSSFRQVQAPPPPVKRLSRAALYALRASALSATAAACGGQFSAAEADKDSGPVEEASMSTSEMSSAAYGAPSFGYNDASVDASDDGASPAVDSSVPVDAHASTDARAEDARVRADAAAPVDANAGDAFTVVAAYGAPIFIDAGRGEQDAHFIALYGAPPIHQ
jgi:hypothetical protein